jgi:hypothetical protein
MRFPPTKHAIIVGDIFKSLYGSGIGSKTKENKKEYNINNENITP